MRTSTFLLLTASVATTIAYPTKELRPGPLTEAVGVGAIIEDFRGSPPIGRIRPDLDNERRLLNRAPQWTNPTKGGMGQTESPVNPPQNYSWADNIEFDHAVHCYHWTVPGHKDAAVGYRKCYFKDEPCNVRWRDDLRAFRANCVGLHANTAAPICSLLWEPDVESPSYCEGKEVPVDADGDRVLPCGEPAGIGPGAKCPSSRIGGLCADEEDCEVLEPNTGGNTCKGVWSACEENFVNVCPGSVMPCQSKCGDPQTCERGYPNRVVAKRALLSWDWDQVANIPKLTVPGSWSAAPAEGEEASADMAAPESKVDAASEQPA